MFQFHGGPRFPVTLDSLQLITNPSHNLRVLIKFNADNDIFSPVFVNVCVHNASLLHYPCTNLNG